MPLIPSGQGGERHPTTRRHICFGQRSDPATGPKHPASLFPLSRGSPLGPPTPSFLPPSSLARPLFLAQDMVLFVCLSPWGFWMPGEDRMPCKQLAHRAPALFPHNEFSLGLQGARPPLCLSFSASPGSLHYCAPVWCSQNYPLGNVGVPLANSVNSVWLTSCHCVRHSTSIC